MERCPSGRRSTPGKRVYVLRRIEGSNPSLSGQSVKSKRELFELIVASIGPFATIGREPRQVRKEATVAADAGAEVWLVLATISLNATKAC
jgi:hypothetical protein